MISNIIEITGQGNRRVVVRAKENRDNLGVSRVFEKGREMKRKAEKTM